MSEAITKALEDFNRYFTSANSVDVPARVSVPRDEWRSLFAALSQAGQGGQGEVLCQLCGLDGQWRGISKSLFEELWASGQVSNLRVLHAAQPAPVPQDVSVVVDVLRRTEMARSVFDAIRKELPGLNFGPWTSFDADAQQRIVDSLIPFTQPAPAVPADFLTHMDAWRNALVLAERNAEVQTPDVDDKAYWRHELAAFDRAYAELLSAAPKPAGKEGAR